MQKRVEMLEFLKKERSWPWTPLDWPAALPLRGFSNPGAYTWEDWDRDTSAQFPVRFFLQRTLPGHYRRLTRRLEDAKWWVIDLFRRPHMIDTRCPGYGLDYHGGYVDVPEQMLCACFALLKTFVEEEYPGHVDWDYSAELRKVRDEALFLHDWWVNARLKEHNEAWARQRDAKTKKERSAAITAANRADRRDAEMLRRLMKIRRYLWT
jgi:hypothetical protein